LIHTVVSKFLEEGIPIDKLALRPILSVLRDQRPGLVQHKDQYQFCYQVIRYAISGGIQRELADLGETGQRLLIWKDCDRIRSQNAEGEDGKTGELVGKPAELPKSDGKTIECLKPPESIKSLETVGKGVETAKSTEQGVSAPKAETGKVNEQVLIKITEQGSPKKKEGQN